MFKTLKAVVIWPGLIQNAFMDFCIIHDLFVIQIYTIILQQIHISLLKAVYIQSELLHVMTSAKIDIQHLSKQDVVVVW